MHWGDYQHEAIPGLMIYLDQAGYVVIKNHGEVRPSVEQGAIVNTWKLEEVAEHLLKIHRELHPEPTPTPPIDPDEIPF